MEKRLPPPPDPDDRALVAPRTAPGAPQWRLEPADPYGPDPYNQEDSGGLLEYWQILKRRRNTILLVSLLGALTGFLLTLPQTPVYQGRASIEIQNVNENFLNMKDVNATTSDNFSWQESYLQTQVKILQSDTLIERVVAKLELEKRPEFLMAPTRPSAWRRALGVPPPAALPPAELARLEAKANLKVRPSAQTRLVDLLYDSTDPQVAAAFPNTLAGEFIEQSLEVRWNATQRTGDWLTRQLQDLKIKLEKSEDALQAHARASGLMFTGEKDSVVEEKLKQLQQELSKAQADRAAKQSQFEVAASSPVESLPEVLDNGPMKEYQVKLADLRRQLAELSSTLTPGNYRVRRVQVQINELERTLTKELGNIVNRIRNEYQSALVREKLLSSAYAAQAKLVSDQAGKAIHYNILKREVETNRQLYETMLQKVKEAGIASAMRASNIRIVDAARPPRRPYKPNLMLNAALGLLAGIFCGVAFVLTREHVDRSLKAPGDAAVYVNVPELGAIPFARTGLATRVKRYSGRRQLVVALRRTDEGDGRGGEGEEVRGKEARALRAPATNGRGGDRVELVTWQHKPSIQAECFRATLTSILFSGQNGNRPRVLVLSSPGAEEGKTTIVSNLGIALAEINRRVLLIDGDMRKPRLHEIFDVANSWGLSDLLREQNPIQECPREALARETEIPGLSVLTSGPGTASISNLLHSPRLAELLERVRAEFDTVLIDTPPMLQLSDARVLGRLADAVILVFRAGQTTRDMAQAARQRFAEDGTPVLGSILNHWNPKATGYGYYDYRYYEERKG